MRPLTQEERDDDLNNLIVQAKTTWDAMSPAEQQRMLAVQRRSFVLAEAGMGSDADEAAYRAAWRRGDEFEMARLDHEAKDRIEAARRIIDAEGKG